MKVVSVSRTEFKTEDDQVFPIDPPLLEDMTLNDFQEHYDFAAALIRSLQAAGNNSEDTEEVGCCGENSDGEKPR